MSIPGRRIQTSTRDTVGDEVKLDLTVMAKYIKGMAGVQPKSVPIVMGIFITVMGGVKARLEVTLAPMREPLLRRYYCSL